MTHTHLNQLKHLFLGVIIASISLFGAQKSNALGGDIPSMINLTGKQRMLSQRIVKDYLYMGQNVARSKAEKQLQASLSAFKKTQKYLKDTIKDSNIRNLISFVNISEGELEGIVKKSYNLDNAQLVLDLSESMLEGSQYIVDTLKAASKQTKSALVYMAGQQRMLAQRIAKYYIAYQAGIRDKNTVDQMQATIKLFSQHHKKLLDNPTNTPAITKELQHVDMLWKIVDKFYKNIKKGGLPFIVFSSTDDITKKMEHIATLYKNSNL